MTSTPYITLVTSLPRLVHFERAERLPINRARLEQRLTMLSREDAAQLGDAEDLLSWERLPLTRTAAQFREQYEKVLPRLGNPSLHAYVESCVEQRTLIAALRKRHLEQTAAPAGTEVWGAGARTGWIERHWEQPDFGLSGLHRWLTEARQFIESQDAVALERLLMKHQWQSLSRIADEYPFAFEEVFAYVLRWDLASRWLSYRADVAKQRFNELIMEAILDSQPLSRSN